MKKMIKSSLILLLVYMNTYAQTEKGLTYQYPLHFYSFTSQTQSLKMAYVFEKATQPNGTTVVLLHGKNFDAAYWSTTIKTLLANGYTVVAPEQVSFGQSSQPEHYQFSFQQLAINTKALLTSLGLTHIVLLGHSMGGMIATRFALMYPNMVTKLILENPIGLEDWKLEVPYTPVDSLYLQEANKSYESVKKYMSSNYFNNSWKPEYDSLVYQNLKIKNIIGANWNAALTSDMIFTQPVVYEFKDLKMPVVFIIGQLDHIAIGKDLVDKQTASTMGNYKQLAPEICKQIKQCKLIKIENAGHVPHIQQPDAFFKALLQTLKGN